MFAAFVRVCVGTSVHSQQICISVFIFERVFFHYVRPFLLYKSNRLFWIVRIPGREMRIDEEPSS